jgi:transposase-like protein
MPKRNYTPEQIIVILRKIEVLCGQGKTIGEAVKDQGITENTYYKWRKQYSGMDVNSAARLKELEKENSRLKKIVANQALDIEMLKDLSSKNF